MTMRARFTGGLAACQGQAEWNPRYPPSMPRRSLCLVLFIAAYLCLELVIDYNGSSRAMLAGVEVIGAAGALTGVLLMARERIRRDLETRSLLAALCDMQRTLARREDARQPPGLQVSETIKRQFERWALSTSEREVAYLLIKGLSLEEIATIRKCAAKTARQHAAHVYAKAGLRGRHELAAYFLEDLLMPETHEAAGAKQANAGMPPRAS